MKRALLSVFLFAAPLVAQARGGGREEGGSGLLVLVAVAVGAAVLFGALRSRKPKRDPKGRYVSGKPAPAKTVADVDVNVQVRAPGGSKGKARK